jgi:hypothetical protein
VSALAHPVESLLTDSLRKHLDRSLDVSNGLLGMFDDCGDGMFHATLDDVGTCENDGMAAVVGYVASSDAWRRFNWRWLISLEQMKLPYLHTAKYLNSFPLVGGNGLTEEDVYTILSPFINIVHAELIERGAVGVCVITECGAYEQLTEIEKKFIREPEVHSFEIAVSQAAMNVRHALNLDNYLAIQVDESHDAPKLYARYEAMKRENETLKDNLASICFCDDKKHHPVQAADMLGNLTLKAWRMYRKTQRWPKAFTELVLPDGKPNMKLDYFGLDRLRATARMRKDQQDRMAMPQYEKGI